MAVMASGGAPTVVINAAPTKHTVLNIVSLKDTSAVKLIGDAILYIFTTAGTHRLTIKNAGTLEVVG
jgi:hypothetical protein